MKERSTRLPALLALALLALCLLSPTTALAAGAVEQATKPPIESPRRATVDYMTGFDFEDYNAIREMYPTNGEYFRSWGEHPIIWKSLVNPQLDLDPWTFDPNQGFLLFQGVPNGININSNSDVALDNYEASGAFTDSSGATVDPVGHWIQTTILDGEEAAIFAAMAIWEWNTPVYVNFQRDDGPLPSLVGVIDRVTLSTPGGVPHEVCDWENGGVANCPGLVVEAVKMTYFSDVPLCCPTVDYFDLPELTGADFVTLYESSFEVGPVVYDPPVSAFDHFDPGMLAVASRAQAQGVALRTSTGHLVDGK